MMPDRKYNNDKEANGRKRRIALIKAVCIAGNLVIDKSGGRL